MKRTHVFGAVAVALALATPVAFSAVAATDQKPEKSPAPVSQVEPARPADNTGINARDKSGATKVPTDQSGAKSDIELAAAVRRAIVDDESLSTLAHNVKVVTQGGTVTLRGPVQNEEEKRQVGQLARLTPGVTNVDNQLDIKQQ
jgi:osmotically-inducible protein OsmY